MIPRAVSPARASSRAAGLSDACLALVRACATAACRMPLVSTLPFPAETWMARPIETWMAFPGGNVGGLSPSETWTLATRLPGAPGKGGCGQHRGRQERGRAVKVQRVERHAGRGVARGERGQVPLLLDEPEHRRVVEHGWDR